MSNLPMSNAATASCSITGQTMPHSQKSQLVSRQLEYTLSSLAFVRSIFFNSGDALSRNSWDALGFWALNNTSCSRLVDMFRKAYTLLVSICLMIQFPRFAQNAECIRGQFMPRKHIEDHYPKSLHLPAQVLLHSFSPPWNPSLAGFSHFSYSSCSASYEWQKQSKCTSTSTFRIKNVNESSERSWGSSYPAEIACPLRNESSGSKYTWGEALHLRNMNRSWFNVVIRVNHKLT